MILAVSKVLGVGGAATVAASLAFLPFNQPLAHSMFAVGAAVALIGILGIVVAPD